MKCKFCNITFVPVNRTHAFCSKKCRDAYYRQANAKKKAQSKKLPKLDRAVSEIEKYNKEHGTRLTYGDYQAMKRLGTWNG